MKTLAIILAMLLSATTAFAQDTLTNKLFIRPSNNDVFGVYAHSLPGGDIKVAAYGYYNFDSDLYLVRVGLGRDWQYLGQKLEMVGAFVQAKDSRYMATIFGPDFSYGSIVLKGFIIASYPLQETSSSQLLVDQVTTGIRLSKYFTAGLAYSAWFNFEKDISWHRFGPAASLVIDDGFILILETFAPIHNTTPQFRVGLLKKW